MRRGRAVDRAMAAAGHLMQRAERQAASREMPVDRLDAKGQHQSPATGRAFEAPDALAKLLDPGADNGRAHVLGNGLGGWYVPVAQVEGRLGAQEGQIQPATDERLGEVRRIVARDRDLDVL